MIDINADAEKTLAALPYKLVYTRPEQWNELPVISFYDLNTSGAFASDNETDIDKGLLVIDIWARDPSQAAKIACEVISVMNAAGWYTELNRHVDKTDGIYHRTTRFSKIFISQED
ncbi:MAG: hypothetical protein ACI38A_00315 [Candidatus Ornithomonoglobus sp.]